MSRYLVDHLKPLLAIRDAIDQLEGVGRSDTSKNPAHTVASEHLCRLIDLRNGNGVLEIPDEVERHLGKVVRLVAHDVQIPSAEALLSDDDLTEEIQEALSAPVVRAFKPPASPPQIGYEPEGSAGSPDASVSAVDEDSDVDEEDEDVEPLKTPAEEYPR